MLQWKRLQHPVLSLVLGLVLIGVALHPAKALASKLTLKPALETSVSPYPGDSLDDTTVWINPADVNQSLILGTVKASNQQPVQPTGILVFNLQGQALQFLKDGTPNNIDSRAGFQSENGMETLIAASHWWSDKIGFYRVNRETSELVKVTDFQTTVSKLRGLCMGVVEDQFMVVGVGSSGIVEQYRVGPDYKAELLNQWRLASESEGCVIDDNSGVLFVSEENTGIWQFDLNSGAPPRVLDRVRFFGPLKRGLEGMALVDVNGNQHLIVSIQEKSRFAVYDVSREAHLFNFRIGDSNDIDGVSKTDGIHIEKTPTAQFPNGFMIVHDDKNLEPDGNLSTQNFKIVPLESLIELIGKYQSSQP